MSSRKQPAQSRESLRDRLSYENDAAANGKKRVAGIDEAGRGPLAGPVVAACVVIRDADFTEKIDDSKKLSPRQRERSYIDIIKRCDVGIGSASVEEIDSNNIYNATLMAMARAVNDLADRPDHLLIDGNMKWRGEQTYLSLVSGESKSLSIACASIIAKVYRDRLMMELDEAYPVYGFAKHKGYGTKAHVEALRLFGFSLVHRRTFVPRALNSNNH
ncbi:MAG: ribonuclease HII [Candidatus Omnitrophica bacterium]|nr:ribonuclease HII [Candidatus Omnitrophota bacterium]